jgi:hypothetical protein
MTKRFLTDLLRAARYILGVQPWGVTTLTFNLGARFSSSRESQGYKLIHSSKYFESSSTWDNQLVDTVVTIITFSASLEDYRMSWSLEEVCKVMP